MSDNLEYNSAKQQFEIYYTVNILPKLQQIEQIRKKMMFRFLLMVILVVCWLGYVLWHLVISSGKLTEIPVSFNIAGCVAVLLTCLPMLCYYRQSKENLLPVLAGFFGKFNYAYQKKLPEEILSYSKIIKTHDSIKTDDCFEGTYEEIPIKITEYALYQKKYRHTREQTRVVNVKIGNGILFSAQMNKKFSGQTIILKDRGVFNSLVRFKNMQRVGIESPEFEKVYEVYSEDQIEARYLLTPVMLEYMLKVKEIYPDISFSFFNNEILINIEINKNLFECSSFFRTVINKKRIEQSFTELYWLFSIIKTLRLNQKHVL